MHNVHVYQVQSRQDWEPLDEEMEFAVKPRLVDSLHIRDLGHAL